MTRTAVVAIPARDEAARIGDALRALDAARDRLRFVDPSVEVLLVVAADGCTDGTAALAAAAGAVVVETAGGVGAARAAAIDRGLAVHPDACWIAGTDADSRVPPDWLVTHLAAEQAGVDVLLGSIRPDRAEAGEALYRLWRAHDRPGGAHEHVHGANLGLRPAVYRRAGGFLPLLADEDVDLVRRCRALRVRVVGTDESPVVTSARTTGRTPAGFSGWVRRARRGLGSDAASVS